MNDDLFDDLEKAGFGYGAGSGLRRAQDRSMVRSKTVRVTLPDGKEATRRVPAKRPVKYAVAVHVTNDPILGDHWRVSAWLTRASAIPGAIRNAGHVETQTLDVKEDS